MRRDRFATSAGGGLLIAMLAVLGRPGAPTQASCAYVGPIPSVTDGQVLFVGTVTEVSGDGATVRVDRWLAGPARTGDILVRGRNSESSNVWYSVAWEPVVGQTEVIAARPDELGALHASLCSTRPLTIEAVDAIEAAYGPAPSSPPVPSMVPASPTAGPPAPDAPAGAPSAPSASPA